MKIVQEQILFDCLEQFEAGASVESLVVKYPHAAIEIERFLRVVIHLQQLKLQPSLAAKRQSQKLFLDMASQQRSGQRKGWFSWRHLWRSLLPVTSLAMVTVLFGVTFLFASASALPGDLLYNTKRWVESYQVEQAGDATAVFNLNVQLDQERIREVKAVLRTSKRIDVAFEGLINTKQGSNWIIAGVPVKVSEQTEIEGYAGVGARVLVNGRTQNGHLYADSIIVLQEGPAAATPTTTTTPAVTISATPTTTMTHTPMTTPTATTMPTILATATTTNAPTETPTAVPPTATPQPTGWPTAVADNDNDNEAGDNNNDNSGGDNGNNNSGDDNGNDNAGGDNGNDNSGGHSGSDDNDNDNSGNDNENDNSGGDNDNDNGNDNDDDDDDNSGGNSGSGGGDNDNDNDNDGNDNGGGNSGSGGGDNDNENDDNGNENGRRDDD